MSSLALARPCRAGVIATLAVATAVTAAPARQAEPSRTTWRDYGGGPDNARYSTLTQITKRNVNRLTVAWTYPTGDTQAYVFGPVVVDHMMYVLAKNSSLVALDARTGHELWIHANLQGISPRGINYWESRDRRDRRLLYQRNNFLEALDAMTGKPILSFGTNGAVNLREGLGRDVATVGRVQSSNPGKIFENLILLGSATGENYVATPGDVRAFDVVTGKLVWQFHTIPRPGEFGYETWPKDAWKYIGGANTWGEITVDPVRGIAYFPTGSPTYDYYGADRPGANLFGSSLVALDARTGTRLWHFQMVHHDLWDYDNTAAPQLTTVRHNGRSVDVVAQAGKTGFLYVFDRVTGEPLWPIEERPVPKSDVPGEQSWPTQPFPTRPAPFVAQTMSMHDVNPYVLAPAVRQQWIERIARARNGGLFTPPAVDVETVAIPGAQGGANWGNTAAHPTNGHVYVVGINVPSIYKLGLDPPGRGTPPPGGPAATAAAAAQGRVVYEQRCQVCHGAELTGVGGAPSLVNVTSRLSAQAIRDVIASGRLSMPPAPDITATQVDTILAFLSGPAPAGRARGAGPGRGGPPTMPEGPVVASGGAPGAAIGGALGSLGMVGPDYPAGLDVPAVRYYTGYGLENNLFRPPYSTLTAYDLNTGEIRWQRPAGGDDPRAVADGGRNTGAVRSRAGLISTATGLLFQPGSDGILRAHDVDTGAVLWTTPLPGGSTGIPAMYELNGRQYLAVNASQPVGGAGALPGSTPAGGAYVVFALPK